MNRSQPEDLAQQIVDAIYTVHKELGPGLLETAYEMALSHELALRNIRFEREKSLPVIYKDIKLDCGFPVDMLVEDQVVLELKSVEGLLPVHEAQLLNYLRLTGKKLGFLVNFNVSLIKNGIKRRVIELEQKDLRSRDFAL